MRHNGEHAGKARAFCVPSWSTGTTHSLPVPFGRRKTVGDENLGQGCACTVALVSTVKFIRESRSGFSKLKSLRLWLTSQMKAEQIGFFQMDQITLNKDVVVCIVALGAWKRISGVNPVDRVGKTFFFPFVKTSS